MGCCEAKQDESKELNEIISKFELKLGFKSIELKNIVFECLRYSTDLVINHSQLSIFCDHLKIKKETPDYNLIKACFGRDIMGISAVKLITLCILVSKAPRIEKVKTLFEIYQDKNQGLLFESNIKLMVLNIFEISTQYLVNEAISMNNENFEKLTEYKEKLLNSKSLVVFYFFHYIIDTKEFLTTFEFQDFFNKPQLAVLLSSKLMRKFSYKIYKSIDINHDIKSETIESVDINLLEMKSFSKRLSKISSKSFIEK